MDRKVCTLADFKQKYSHTAIGRAVEKAITEFTRSDAKIAVIGLRLYDEKGVPLPDSLDNNVVISSASDGNLFRVASRKNLDKDMNANWEVYTYSYMGDGTRYTRVDNAHDFLPLPGPPIIDFTSVRCYWAGMPEGNNYW